MGMKILFFELIKKRKMSFPSKENDLGIVSCKAPGKQSLL